jgi:uncharacterized protein YegL
MWTTAHTTPFSLTHLPSSHVPLPPRSVFCVGFAFALNTLIISRATAARFYGFAEEIYPHGSVSVALDVATGASGTASVAGTIYLAITIIDQGLKASRRAMSNFMRACIAAFFVALACLWKSRRARRQATGSHIVYVLDRSGSMGGQPWTDLTAAFERGLINLSNDPNSSGMTNEVSIVAFDHEAIVVLTRAPVSDASIPSHISPRGATVYSGALDAALGVLKTTPDDKQPVLMFMSDGEPTDDAGRIGNSLQRIKDWASGTAAATGTGTAAGSATSSRSPTAPALVAHGIIFGDSSTGAAEVRKVAAALNGTFHTALTATDLTAAFSAVSVAVAAAAIGFDPFLLFRVAFWISSSLLLGSFVSLYAVSQYLFWTLVRTTWWTWWWGYGLHFTIKHFKRAADSANFLVCVVAGVTGENFLTAGIRSLRLVFRDTLNIAFVAGISWKVRNAANLALNPITWGISYMVVSGLGAFSEGTFLLGCILSSLLISSALDALFTTSIANAACILEQRAADRSAIPGSPEARRVKGEVEREALDMLKWPADEVGATKKVL